jgi:hypothetical protein
MVYCAKKAIWEVGPVDEGITQRFPLKPVCVFLGKNKLTSDKGEALRFWEDKKLAREHFYKLDIFYAQAFDKVDWESVVVGQLYSIQYKSIFGVPDKVRCFTCDEARQFSQV